MDDEFPPRKASDWLTALLERPDDARLRERFDAWLAADRANAADWAEIARTYEVMGRTPPAHRDHWAAYAATRGVPRQPPDVAFPGQTAAATRGSAARARPFRAALGLAAAAAVICLLVAASPELWLRATADHVTATAEVRTLRLADGSIVRLGPESAIDVVFSGRERGVRLLQGKAFFEVTPDPSRPFRVRASPLDATVLGTAFEVRLDDGGADVAVRHGTVRVDGDEVPPSASVALKSGDWVRVGRSGAVTRGVRPPEQIAAWLQGRLIAKDRPVGEVVEELRRYYHGLVILRGDDLANQPLTGVYNLADPVTALRAVASAQGAAFTHLSPWVLVISAR